MALPPFVIDSSLVPRNRRAQHQKAIDVIEAHERSGAPFVLMLQSYRVMQQIVRSETEVGDDLENLLADSLPYGVGFVEIQPPGADAFSQMRFRDSSTFRIHAPALVLTNDTWFEAVTWLIQRAEMFVVLMGLDSAGLTRELGALVENGRTDRTVVLYNELIAHAMPFLDRFGRVLSVADLESDDVLRTFVFTDLLDRLVQIREAPHTPLPVSATGVRDAFERLAIRCRWEGRAAAVRYLANAVRLSLDEGDTDAALQMTSARLDLVSNDEGAQIVASLETSLGKLSRNNPSHVMTMARLAILRVKTMTDLDAAIALLDSESQQCLEPLHRPARSALQTMRAWLLRQKRDEAGAIQTADKALELAEEEGANLEVARALHVVGVLWHERGELERARQALQRASDLMPRDRFNDDLILILLRLGDVMRAAGVEDTARSVFDVTLQGARAVGLPQLAAIALERRDAAPRM